MYYANVSVFFFLLYFSIKQNRKNSKYKKEKSNESKCAWIEVWDGTKGKRMHERMNEKYVPEA